MLEWIPAFFEKVTAFVPRFEKVTPTERLVKWSRCGEATLHGPGIVWHWPLLTEVERCDVRWKSLTTHVQTVTLNDGTPVSARTMTRWKPTDVLHAVTSEEDHSETVAETAQSVLVDVLAACNAETVQKSLALNAALTLQMKKELRDIGVSVKKSKFTELCITPAFRIVNDG